MDESLITLLGLLIFVGVLIVTVLIGIVMSKRKTQKVKPGTDKVIEG